MTNRKEIKDYDIAEYTYSYKDDGDASEKVFNIVINFLISNNYLVENHFDNDDDFSDKARDMLLNINKELDITCEKEDIVKYNPSPGLKKLEFKFIYPNTNHTNVAQYIADSVFGRFIIKTKSNTNGALWEVIGPTYQGISPGGGSAVFKTEILALYDFSDKDETIITFKKALEVCKEECQKHFEYLCEQTVLE